MKISVKLILSFLGVALLVLVVGFFSANMSQQALQDSIGKSSCLLAGETMDKIDRYIFQVIQKWRSWALMDNDLKKALIVSNQAFEALEDKKKYMAKQDELWTSVSHETITPFMETLINNDVSMLLKRKALFHKDADQFDVFPEIFVTNKYGANIAQTGKTSDYCQCDESWWVNAVKDGFFVEDVKYDESADIYAMNISIRIDDENNELLGVVKIVMNIKNITNILTELQEVSGQETGTSRAKYKSRYFVLVNKDNKVIFATRPFELFEDIDPLVSTVSKCAYKTPGHQDYGVVYDPHHNSQELVVHAYSEGYGLYKGLGWMLIVEHDAKLVFAPVERLKRVLLLMSLIVTLCAIIIGLWIARGIAYPLTKLRNAIEEVGKGHLDAEITVCSNDEIGGLAEAFLKMVETLQGSMVSIENFQKEIAERHKVEQGLAGLNQDLQANEKALRNMLYDLKKSNEELRDTQRQLVQSEKLASIGQLAAGIAHEINNPVGFINTNLSSLEKYTDRFSQLYRAYALLKNAVYENNAEKVKELAGQIVQLEDTLKVERMFTNLDDVIRESKEGVERIRRIVLDLKTFSRRDEDQHIRANVNEIFDGIINIVWNEIKYKAELEKDYGDIPSVFCNPQQLGQVFINILVNAVQSIDEFGKICIITRAIDKYITVKISDTGKGMAPEMINKIFDPFFTTKEVGKGTGLGLSVSQEIIKKHNGTIEVESAVGEGTTFIIKLPCQQSNG